jgi:hypothetical protein
VASRPGVYNRVRLMGILGAGSPLDSYMRVRAEETKWRRL